MRVSQGEELPIGILKIMPAVCILGILQQDIANVCDFTMGRRNVRSIE
jgi:hypothetical protein